MSSKSTLLGLKEQLLKDVFENGASKKEVLNGRGVWRKEQREKEKENIKSAFLSELCLYKHTHSHTHTPLLFYGLNSQEKF